MIIARHRRRLTQFLRSSSRKSTQSTRHTAARLRYRRPRRYKNPKAIVEALGMDGAASQGLPDWKRQLNPISIIFVVRHIQRGKCTESTDILDVYRSGIFSLFDDANSAKEHPDAAFPIRIFTDLASLDESQGASCHRRRRPGRLKIIQNANEPDIVVHDCELGLKGDSWPNRRLWHCWMKQRSEVAAA